jgi:hypothetical protein
MRFAPVASIEIASGKYPAPVSQGSDQIPSLETGGLNGRKPFANTDVQERTKDYREDRIQRVVKNC